MSHLLVVPVTLKLFASCEDTIELLKKPVSSLRIAVREVSTPSHLVSAYQARFSNRKKQIVLFEFAPVPPPAVHDDVIVVDSEDSASEPQPLALFSEFDTLAVATLLPPVAAAQIALSQHYGAGFS